MAPLLKRAAADREESDSTTEESLVDILAGEDEGAAESDSATRSDRKRVPAWRRAYRTALQRKRSWGEREPREASQWTAGNGFKTKATTGVLALAILAGTAAFLQLNLFESDAAPTQVGGGFDQRMMNRQSAANEAATQFVPAWLTATRESSTTLRKWWPQTSDLDLPAASQSVTGVSVVRAEASAPGVWTVVVGANVTSPKDTNVVSRRYFQVPIAVNGTSPVAAKPVALPAEIPAPSTTVPRAELAYPNRVSPSAGAMTTTRGFLSALLAGQGDIRLYERPGTWIPPIAPPSADSIRVSDLVADADSADSATGTAAPTDGQRASVLATVTLLSGDQARTLQYALRLVARDGRWEVVSVSAPPTMQTDTSTGPSS